MGKFKRYFLQSISDKLDFLIQQNQTIIMDFTGLIAAAQAETDAETAILKVVTDLAAQIKALAPTQAAIDALAKQLTDNAARIAAAVVANTPPAN